MIQSVLQYLDLTTFIYLSRQKDCCLVIQERSVTYFLELISVLSIRFHRKLLSFLPATYFHFPYHKTGTMTSDFASVCSYSVF